VDGTDGLLTKDNGNMFLVSGFNSSLATTIPLRKDDQASIFAATSLIAKSTIPGGNEHLDHTNVDGDHTSSSVGGDHTNVDLTLQQIVNKKQPGSGVSFGGDEKTNTNTLTTPASLPPLSLADAHKYFQCRMQRVNRNVKKLDFLVHRVGKAMAKFVEGRFTDNGKSIWPDQVRKHFGHLQGHMNLQSDVQAHMMQSGAQSGSATAASNTAATTKSTTGSATASSSATASFLQVGQARISVSEKRELPGGTAAGSDGSPSWHNTYSDELPAASAGAAAIAAGVKPGHVNLGSIEEAQREARTQELQQEQAEQAQAQQAQALQQAGMGEQAQAAVQGQQQQQQQQHLSMKQLQENAAKAHEKLKQAHQRTEKAKMALETAKSDDRTRVLEVKKLPNGETVTITADRVKGMGNPEEEAAQDEKDRADANGDMGEYSMAQNERDDSASVNADSKGSLDSE
jgi:hypothetical protein